MSLADSRSNVYWRNLEPPKVEIDTNANISYRVRCYLYEMIILEQRDEKRTKRCIIKHILNRFWKLASERGLFHKENQNGRDSFEKY
jgi:hypothetical protein